LTGWRTESPPVPLQFDDILPTLKVILAKLKAKSNVVDPCLGFMIESLRALLRTLPSVQGKEQNAIVQYANHITEYAQKRAGVVTLTLSNNTSKLPNPNIQDTISKLSDISTILKKSAVDSGPPPFMTDSLV
jgi:hypothetical protein